MPRISLLVRHGSREGWLVDMCRLGGWLVGLVVARSFYCKSQGIIGMTGILWEHHHYHGEQGERQEFM